MQEDYVAKVGDRFWLKYKGLQIVLLLDDNDFFPRQSAAGRAAIGPAFSAQVFVIFDELFYFEEAH